jgi:environmental stress-induced protein Ves
LRGHRTHPWRALAFGAALAVPCATGCGPIEYLDTSAKAGAALAAAKQADAEHLAPYEYTAATEYLHKAREEAGYSQYQQSIEFGHRAEAMASRARALSTANAQEKTAPAAPPPAAVPPAPSPPPAAANPSSPARPAVDDEQPRKR